MSCSTLRYNNLIDGIIEKDINIVRNKIAKENNFKPFWQIYAGDNNKLEADGERLVREVVSSYKKLDEKYIKLRGFDIAYYQRRARKEFLSAFMKKLLGRDFDKCVVRVMKEYGLDDVGQDVILDQPRRMGKTFISGEFVGVILYNRAGTIINIYSMTRNNSARVTREANEAILLLVDDNENVDVHYSSQSLRVIRNGGRESIANSCQGKNVDINDSKEKIFFILFTKKKKRNECNCLSIEFIRITLFIQFYLYNIRFLLLTKAVNFL